MKRFNCSNCKNRLHFESASCLNCGHPVGFDIDTMTMAALKESGAGVGLYRKVNLSGAQVRLCDNATHGACTWLVPETSASKLCRACNLNRTIPNLSEQGSLEKWQALERAKKRVIYSLARFGLPFDGSEQDVSALTFDFLPKVLTGHHDGAITIDLAEADAVEQERRRILFDEQYRSLLGHLRHEIGHYYWMLLIDGTQELVKFRALFGDERQDYKAALETHHANGPAPDWISRFVSAYASCHPWEDWAETFAHYLHMVDAVETAEAEGMEPRAAGLLFGASWPFRSYDVYRDETFDALMERWIPLTLAVNNLSRSMGHRDFYPFVISPPAREKLGFVHRVVRGRPGNKSGRR